MKSIDLIVGVALAVALLGVSAGACAGNAKTWGYNSGSVHHRALAFACGANQHDDGLAGEPVGYIQVGFILILFFIEPVEFSNHSF